MAESFERIVRQLAAINPGEISYDRVRALILAAKKAIAPPTPEQPELPSSPWKCCICGDPVGLASVQPYHLNGPANHAAELSDTDKTTLAGRMRSTS